MGGVFEKIIPERNYFYIKINNEKIFINERFVINNSLFSRKQLTNFKDLTYILLKEAGIPTPNTVCFYKKTLNESILKTKLSKLSYPIVIKDANGSHSEGVFINIKTFEEAEEIILREIRKYPCLVAQETALGKEYRILILGNKAIGVLEMIPPRVFGDGESTVKELIEKKQATIKEKTPLDSFLVEILKEQGETLESIPSSDKEVFIKKNSCLAEGGETRDVTEKINKKIEALCVKASRIVGKELTGIDIMCDDISKDPNKQNFNILEANRRPDLYIHYTPTYGEARNIVKDIIEFILKIKKQETTNETIN